MKPTEILHRDREWAALETMWARDRPQLVFVLGRRRIGKSFVLARFSRQVGGIYYQATRRTEAEQLAQLSRVVGEHVDDAALRQGASLASWEALLGYLTERAGKDPFLIILDEFPYLVAAQPALPSILQKFWDHDWADTRIRVVLSGSYVSAMRELEQGDQPLYGRRTTRLLFGPFAFADARAFMPGYSATDQLALYSVFGHLPGHLALIDPRLSLAENAAAASLDSAGPLVDDAQHMLDAFLGEARIHYSILEAIATGEHTWSGISRRVGQGGGALLRPLRWLEEMGLALRVAPITEKAPDRSKRALYRVADPYLAYWHRMIAPLYHAGSIGIVEAERLWEQTVAPRLSEHLGPVFEQACRDFASRSNRLPVQPVRVGEWWDADSRNQVDLVSIDEDRRLLVGECEWGAVTREDLATLRARAARIEQELGGASARHLALFSARDEADETVRAAVAAGEVLYFTAADVAAHDAIR